MKMRRNDMYCKNCGKPIPDNTKFCPYCGTQFSSAESFSKAANDMFNSTEKELGSAINEVRQGRDIIMERN